MARHCAARAQFDMPHAPPPVPGATSPTGAAGIPAAPRPAAASKLTRYTLCLAQGDKDLVTGIASGTASVTATHSGVTGTVSVAVP